MTVLVIYLDSRYLSYIFTAQILSLIFIIIDNVILANME